MRPEARLKLAVKVKYGDKESLRTDSVLLMYKRRGGSFDGSRSAGRWASEMRNLRNADRIESCDFRDAKKW